MPFIRLGPSRSFEGITAKSSLTKPVLPKKTLNNIELENKWKGTWNNIKPEDDGVRVDTREDHELPPLWLFHARHHDGPMTILDYLTSEHMASRKGNGMLSKEQTLYDRIWNASLRCHTRSNVLALKDQHGADAVRTALVFFDKAFENVDITKSEVREVLNLFQETWSAVIAAHESFLFLQNSTYDTRGLGALNGPNADGWLDYISTEHYQFVLRIPEDPGEPDRKTEEETFELWSAAQTAAYSYTASPTNNSRPRAVFGHLCTLALATKNYADGDHVCTSTHYHAARILVSLLAPTAPSFAEECWLLLHYGYDGYGNETQGVDGEDEHGAWSEHEKLSDKQFENYIRDDFDYDDLRGLPRSWPTSHFDIHLQAALPFS